MLTNAISVFAIACLEMAGYFGAAFLMALESMIFPVPSEAVMPFVGFLVADGKWNLEVAILVTSMGSLIGSLISYTMGYYGGKPFILKVGRYFLLNRHDLKITEDFFSRRGGNSCPVHKPVYSGYQTPRFHTCRNRQNAPFALRSRYSPWLDTVEFFSSRVRDVPAGSLEGGHDLFSRG